MTTIGYVVIEYNQASHQPDLLPGANLEHSREDAEELANQESIRAAAVGRHEWYAVAAVELVLDGEGDGG